MRDWLLWFLSVCMVATLACYAYLLYLAFVGAAPP